MKKLDLIKALKEPQMYSGSNRLCVINGRVVTEQIRKESYTGCWN